MSLHFFHLLPCTLFFPPSWTMFVLPIKQSFEMEWEFSFRISFSSFHHFLARRKSVPVVTQSSSKHQSSVAEGSVKGGNTDGEGWKQYRKGDPHKCLAPSDLLNGFPLSGCRESGWEGSGVLPTPFGASVHRHGHSVATRLHAPLLIVQRSK